MADESPQPTPPEPTPAVPADTVVRKSTDGDAGGSANGSRLFAFRRPIPQWLGILLGMLCLALVSLHGGLSPAARTRNGCSATIRCPARPRHSTASNFTTCGSTMR